jgi:serine/threonine-protein kinase RsbW
MAVAHAAPLVLSLEGTMAAFETGREALRKFLEDAGAGAGALYRAELVFEELVTNIIRYAHAGSPEKRGPIQVTAGVHDSEILLTLEDDGAPFNPLQAPLAPPPASMKEAKLGGLGLRLVQSAAKRIAYERIDRHNRVTVVLGLS